MINSFIRYGLIFILLVLLQVLLFNNIQFSGFINPYVYIMFILLLPVEIPSWLLLILSFITGAVIDFFTGSPGMHSFATVLAGFARPAVLQIISAREAYETGSPSLNTYGLRSFLIYASIIVLIHHTTLFFLEVFRFTDFFRTLIRIILSSFFTLVFILLLESYRKRK